MTNAERHAQKVHDDIQKVLETVREKLRDADDALLEWRGNPLLHNGLATAMERLSDDIDRASEHAIAFQQEAHKRFRHDRDPKITPISGRQAG